MLCRVGWGWMIAGGWWPVPALMAVDAPLAEGIPDKRGFSLGRPTPAPWMRELSADRPDKTDSPFTVDAGHFQVEMDAINAGLEHHGPERDGSRTTTWEVAPMNLKVGLLNNVDLQLGLTPLRFERVAGPAGGGGVERHGGTGDVVPRVKFNLFGNDGGPWAMALMPCLKVPTAAAGLGNGAVEGALKVPVAIEAGDWDVGFQTELDLNRDDAGPGCHLDYVNSVSIGHPVAGRLSAYVEFYSSVPSVSGAGWVGTVDTWLTYRVHRNLRLEAGVYIGVTRPAEDWHPFLGMTWRY